jgi:hypothetical protein
MSDFLSKVTARALGTAPVVQPRVPSLFEPHRSNEGPFVTRSASSFADGPPGVQESGVDAQTPDAKPFRRYAPTPQQLQEQALFAPEDSAARENQNPGQHPTPTQPTTHALSRPQQAQGAIALSDPRLHKSPSLAARLEVSPPAPAQTNPTRLSTTLPEAPQSSASPQAVRPPGMQHGQAFPGPAGTVSVSESTQQHAQPVPDPASLPVGMPAVRAPVANASETIVHSPVPLMRRGVNAGSSLRAPHLPTAEVAPIVNAPGASAPAIQRKAIPPQHSLVAGSDSAAKPGFPDRHLLPVPTQFPSQESSPPPSAPARAAQPGAEIRPRTVIETAIVPPGARRMEAAEAPVALRTPSPAEPAIEITIGTVEVRAVLPEKPAPRAQSRRPKPGISLDEYLKRSSRGSR